MALRPLVPVVAAAAQGAVALVGGGGAPKVAHALAHHAPRAGRLRTRALGALVALGQAEARADALVAVLARPGEQAITKCPPRVSCMVRQSTLLVVLALAAVKTTVPGTPYSAFP